VCTTGVSGGVGRFRLEDGTTILGRRQGQSTTVKSLNLNQNGRYVCYNGGREWGISSMPIHTTHPFSKLWQGAKPIALPYDI
jgi:hypothetical protein